MPHYNQITVLGHVGRDPEVKQAKSGANYTKFSLAVTNYGKKDAEGKPSTDWFNVTCFGKTADKVAQDVRKGDVVMAIGNASIESWTGKDGQYKSSIAVLANQIVTTTSKRDRPGDSIGRDNENNEDIPF